MRAGTDQYRFGQHEGAQVGEVSLLRTEADVSDRRVHVGWAIGLRSGSSEVSHGGLPRVEFSSVKGMLGGRVGG